MFLGGELFGCVCFFPFLFFVFSGGFFERLRDWGGLQYTILNLIVVILRFWVNISYKKYLGIHFDKTNKYLMCAVFMVCINKNIELASL